MKHFLLKYIKLLYKLVKKFIYYFSYTGNENKYVYTFICNLRSKNPVIHFPPDYFFVKFRYKICVSNCIFVNGLYNYENLCNVTTSIF